MSRLFEEFELIRYYGSKKVKGMGSMGKRVLVISKGFIHPSFICRISLKLLLEDLRENFSFVYTNTLKGLERLGLERFDAVILYYHQKRVRDNALNTLIRFAGNGGGVLALHSAAASFKTKNKYRNLLGGRFVGHGKIEHFDVHTKDVEHELLTEPVAFTVRDELYLHEYDRDNTIILACDNKGEEEPVMWARGYGSGRVCYLSTGHLPNVFRREEVKRVINDALGWVCRTGGQV